MNDLNGHGWLKRIAMRWLFGAPVKGVQVTRLQPGDTLVLKLGFPVSAEAMERVSRWTRKTVPDGVQVLVIEPDADVSVLRQLGVGVAGDKKCRPDG